MQAPLHACTDPSHGARVIAVGVDHRDAPAVRTVGGAGVPALARVLSEHPPWEEWGESLRDAVVAYKPDIVILAGFLKLVGPEFLAAPPQRVVNTHNVFSPSFPGVHGPADALVYGAKVMDTTLFVVDLGMDTGSVLGQTTYPVLEGDSEEALIEQAKEVERVQLVGLIGRVACKG